MDRDADGSPADISRGVPCPDVPAALQAELSGRTVHRLERPPGAASSTRIRELLAAGDPIPEGWLPAPVVEYCQKYDLYR